MYKVSFGVSHDDPLRTVAKRLKDFKSIDKINTDLNTLNEKLQEKINTLKIEKKGLIQSYQNIKELDCEQIKKRIEDINTEIKSNKSKIETNKNMLVALYYGYHERI